MPVDTGACSEVSSRSTSKRRSYNWREIRAGVGSIPEISYADGEIRDCELDGIILLDVTDPDAKLESSDADDMIRAHEEREKNGSRKRERGGGSVGKDKGKSPKVRK